MSRELFKSLTYKDGKVYTRQCSSNVSPKHFYNEENKHFTKLYSELGKEEFEKWFLVNGILQGSVEVLSGSNTVLRKLNYFANVLWKDKNYKVLRDRKDITFDRMMAESKDNKGNAYNEYTQVREDMEKYVSSFYDTHNSRYKTSIKER